MPVRGLRTNTGLMAHTNELAWLEQSVGVLALDDRTIISVAGDDARDWLQGQITNQLEHAQPGSSVYGFVLTLKGRIFADRLRARSGGRVFGSMSRPRRSTPCSNDSIDTSSWRTSISSIGKTCT